MSALPEHGSSAWTKLLVMAFLCLSVFKVHAGVELVCKGSQARSHHKVVIVNCANRKEFVEILGAAWRELVKNSIGGSVENLCFEAYRDAKDMHPSISFSNISDSFLVRCNMGLAYVQ